MPKCYAVLFSLGVSEDGAGWYRPVNISTDNKVGRNWIVEMKEKKKQFNTRMKQKEKEGDSSGLTEGDMHCKRKKHS